MVLLPLVAHWHNGSLLSGAPTRRRSQVAPPTPVHRSIGRKARTLGAHLRPFGSARRRRAGGGRGAASLATTTTTTIIIIIIIMILVVVVVVVSW